MTIFCEFDKHQLTSTVNTEIREGESQPIRSSDARVSGLRLSGSLFVKNLHSDLHFLLFSAFDKSLKMYIDNFPDDDIVSQPNEMTLSMLPDDCLRAVFLRLDLMSKVHLRAVCKQWKRVSDDCWRDIKALCIKTDDRNKDTILENGKEITINAGTRQKTTGLIKHCARYVSTLVDRRSPATFSILPAIRHCSQVEVLRITIRTMLEDEHLRKFFLVNVKIRTLQLTILDPSPFTCLSALNAHHLKELNIYVDTFCLLPELITTPLGRIIRDAPLKKLIINHIFDTLFEELQTKTALEYLSIRVLDAGDNLNYIACLSNLQCLLLHCLIPVVTDEFLDKLSNGCVHLEILNINRCNRITITGLLALAGLKKLQELSLERMARRTERFEYIFAFCPNVRFSYE